MVFGKHINRYYVKYGIWLIIGLAALVAVDYLQLLIPGLYQMVINGINDGYVSVDGVRMAFDMDFLLDRICLPITGIIISLVTGRFIWRICFFGSAVKVEAEIRSRMFDKAKDLDQEFYQCHKVGDMMSLFTNDLDAVQESFGYGILMFFDALMLALLSVIKMWNMDPLLTVFAMIPMAFLTGTAALVGRYMMRKWDYRQACFSKLSDFSQECFSGIAVVKAFVKEAKELAAFRVLSKENEEANVEYTRLAVLLKIMVVAFVESVICVILGYGGYLVYEGTFNAGQLVEFIGYFVSIIWPVMAVAELTDIRSRGKASLKRVSALLDAEPTVVDREGTDPLPEIRGNIELRDLTFRYPDGEYDVLKHISLSIRAGENIGLVGKTGCGKTTLVDLLLRTYNVPDGTVFIDGHDVNSVAIRDVRAGCAYVPQDNFLFSDTIYNNISFGTDGEKPEEISRVAELADIAENIGEFQLGYQTILGERGVTVSGGQKQRISIARALLRNAPILILDDSVSAVDTKTERTILENLRKTRQGKTTILIAHRISTIEQMDRIVFLEDGKLAGLGTHQELYASCHEYRRMVDLQKLEEEGGDQNA